MRALLSIKPEYAEKIFSGEKRFEFRKTVFRASLTSIIIYITAPVKKIAGEFKVLDVLCDSPQKIWKKTQDYAGISEVAFFNYYSGKHLGIAIEIGAVKRYAKAIDPYERFSGNFTPPQSFRYLEHPQNLSLL